jgi:hypothetical protein
MAGVEVTSGRRSLDGAVAAARERGGERPSEGLFGLGDDELGDGESGLPISSNS